MRKPKTMSNKMSIIGDKWGQAIKDTEDEIRSLTRHKSRLQQAVRIFRANKQDGAPWPGDRIVGQNG